MARRLMPVARPACCATGGYFRRAIQACDPADPHTDAPAVSLYLNRRPSNDASLRCAGMETPRESRMDSCCLQRNTQPNS